ncbi:hypothetical protein PI124_g20320 [Phytophthora idaei]|nr:hypothetical protein PI126_g19978 [Phytophthora idaei]KAG3234625.1 hypothetical protein PI124_g20320 [Phytophthora idaei]
MEMETGNEEFELCRAGLRGGQEGFTKPRHRSWRAATCVGRCVSRTAGLPRRNHVRLSPVQHTDSIPHNSKICSYSSCNTMVPSIARPSTANVDEKKTTYKSEL